MHLRRLFWRFQIVATVGFLLFGLYLALFARPIRWAIVIPILAVIGLAYFSIIFVHYRHQMRVLYSVRVELDGSGVIFNRYDQDPLRISRADIIRATERKDGLFIETIYPRLNMLIPNGLARDGDRAVREDVSAWVRIEPVNRRGYQGLYWVRTGAYALAFIILLFVNQFWLSAGTGLLLFGYVVFAGSHFDRIYNITPGTARFYSSALVFVIFLVFMKFCLLGVLWLMGW